MTTRRRYFQSLPVFATEADVHRYCEAVGVVNCAGYPAIDGLRCMVELPEVAMGGVADQARDIERQAAELRATAEKMLDKIVQGVPR